MTPLHHHDLIEVFDKDASAFFFTEMQAMWALMVIMFAWNVVMTVQHRKLKAKVSCNCKEKNI